MGHSRHSKDRVAERIKEQDPQEIHFNERTQTESEGGENDIPCKVKLKESRTSYTYTKQNRC